MDRGTENIEELLADAAKRFRMPRHLLEIRIWQQTWPCSACGFKQGVSARVLTTAETHIFLNPDLPNEALVYHAGKFAYRAKTNELFLKACEDKKLIGVNYCENYPYYLSSK